MWSAYHFYLPTWIFVLNTNSNRAVIACEGMLIDLASTNKIYATSHQKDHQTHAHIKFQVQI